MTRPKIRCCRTSGHSALCALQWRLPEIAGQVSETTSEWPPDARQPEALGCASLASVNRMDDVGQRQHGFSGRTGVSLLPSRTVPIPCGHY